MRLAQVDRQPDEAEAYRQVIMRGLMLRDNGSRRAVELLEKWTGEKVGAAGRLVGRHAGGLAAVVCRKVSRLRRSRSFPQETERNQWTSQELMSYLTGPQASQAVAARGAAIFEKAQCIKCHRFGERGDTVGPDLTNVSKRFQKKEILESILFPSQVISDQYGSQLDRDQGRQELHRHGRPQRRRRAHRAAGQRREGRDRRSECRTIHRARKSRQCPRACSTR